ncbi:MAG: rod-binding protein, partial [Gammaproteobacteria bacterium]|nr:rod-binding protein [Gammaproteobacteria bacterium]
MAQVYTDFSSLAAMRAKAREDEGAALDQVSRQFESLFVQMMLKSMRDASMGGGLLDSKQSEFYREMYDKQIAMDMSGGKGIGLADVLKRQLGGGIASTYQDLSPEDYLGMPVMAAARVGRQQADDDSAGAVADPVAVAQLDGDPEKFLEQL